MVAIEARQVKGRAAELVARLERRAQVQQHRQELEVVVPGRAVHQGRVHPLGVVRQQQPLAPLGPKCVEQRTELADLISLG